MNTDEKEWVRQLPAARGNPSIRRTLRQRTHRQGSRVPGTDPAEIAGLDRAFSRAIVCGACRHRITRERDRIKAGGNHEHRFFNPHGFLFHIGCFRRAGGCLTTGAASLEFTWFPGYAWRLALCRGCLQHLGWRFDNTNGDSFFGLILNRLMIEEHGAQ